MEIGDFIPGRGYRVFVPTEELVSFRYYIVHATEEEKKRYSLNPAEQAMEGGVLYSLGLHRSPEEMQEFKMNWDLKID